MKTTEFPDLNQKEAMAMLKCSWKKLRRLERDGRIRVVRLSLGTLRYFKSDLEKVLKTEGVNL